MNAGLKSHFGSKYLDTLGFLDLVIVLFKLERRERGDGAVAKHVRVPEDESTRSTAGAAHRSPRRTAWPPRT